MVLGETSFAIGYLGEKANVMVFIWTSLFGQFIRLISALSFGYHLAVFIQSTPELGSRSRGRKIVGTPV